MIIYTTEGPMKVVENNYFIIENWGWFELWRKENGHGSYMCPQFAEQVSTLCKSRGSTFSRGWFPECHHEFMVPIVLDHFTGIVESAKIKLL